MNASAAQNASPAQKGVLPCQKKSWFAIRLVDDKDKMVAGLTLKLKVTGLGETERVTVTATDPLRIDQLDPGGKADVLSVESAEGGWEAVGDLT